MPRTLLGDPQPAANKAAGEFVLELKPADKGNSAFWNELIDLYHYLGYKPLPGVQLCYFVASPEGTVALLGLSAAAWTTAARLALCGGDPGSWQERYRAPQRGAGLDLVQHF